MTIPEIATQVSKGLSAEGLKEYSHRLMTDAVDRMCQRFRPGYKETYRKDLWAVAQEQHKEWAAKVRGLVSKVLAEQEAAGLLVIGEREHVDGDGRPTGVVRQGDVLKSLIDLLNEIKDDKDVPASTRAQVYQSLLKVAEKIDVENTQVVVQDFTDAWPGLMDDVARNLDELAQQNVARLSGGKSGGGVMPEVKMPDMGPDLDDVEQEPDY